MTPIEKVRAKSSALETLGLGHYATPAEIREAWKRIAFETHPDRNTDGEVDFARAKAAYDLLRDGISAPLQSRSETPPADKPAKRTGPRLGPRPVIATRTMALGQEAAAQCRALLTQTGRDDGSNVVYLAAAKNESDAKRGGVKDHVPEAVHCRGRKLTYVVRAPLAEGRNRVALPTGILESKVKLRPMILAFLSSEAGSGEIRVPDDVRATLFPGARQVDIRFSAV